MIKVFLINNRVLFNPAEHILHSEDSQIQIKLFTPVSDCLKFIIENKSRVITQDELMHHVWMKNGELVSPNAFYQNISLLRKALRNSGLEGIIIKTVPRKGVVLNDDVVIDTLQNDSVHTLHTPTLSPHRYKGTLINVWGNNRKKVIYSLLSFFFVAVICLGIFLSDLYQKEYYLDDYIEFYKSESCSWYAPPQQLKIRSNEISMIATERNSHCKGNAKEYITYNETTGDQSIIHCSSIKDYCEIFLRRYK